MIGEPEFKKRLLITLNSKIGGWVDGDKENRDGKKVDVLNHKLLVAIEIKDDTKYKIIADGRVHTNDLVLMNQRFSDHIKSANAKFKIYPSYKTIVLFRTEHIAPPIKYVIEGLDQFQKVDDELKYVGKIGKYSKFAKDQVGVFLIINHEISYFQNKFAKPEKIISLQDIIKYTGWNIKNI